jgi:hypothetical protein
MSTSKTQKFVLVGPHAGKTIAINGHEFVDGEFTYAGSEQQVATLARVLEFYGAVPAEQAELQELRAEKQSKGQVPPTRKQLDEALAGLPGEQTDPDYVVNSMRSFFGDLFTSGDEMMVRETVVAKPATDAGAGADLSDAPKPTLAEAIGLLDPEVDSHWTSNNLPGLDDLERLTGKKVSRQEVDAIASGYTRAKARQAKAGN